eukprot:TRINITY_DN99_c2_g1_i1.p1 TRINITY_DN99_c2_g1~~TRINITY_DN99_c2_g1_i1.p1  ORF type:complete len:240 (-),score=99.92 TRINITY_DN99_c2_g1_i1:95-814(-)
MTDVETIPTFDTTLKKKKKKVQKKEETVDAQPSIQSSSISDESEPKINFGAKKPAKKKKAFEIPTEEKVEIVENQPKPETKSNVEPELSYEDLLKRLYESMEGGAAKQTRAKFQIPPIQLGRDGNKKTIWVNFNDICRVMNRPPEHVLLYAFAELGTTGSVDGSQQLVIKGRFQPKQLESVVRHYITEYVSCRTCKSPSTILKKENRLHFVQCKACGSTRTVTAIKQGFMAQVGKRKKQ